jgi:hypothetical protein
MSTILCSHDFLAVPIIGDLRAILVGDLEDV